MKKERLETFSDSMIAILMTVMVLGLRIPRGSSLASLSPLLPQLGCYVISFGALGIYWNNHHHLLHAAERINGRILWANLHLLFWLSLVPFVTGWTGENGFASLPTAVYGAVLFFAAVAYWILKIELVRAQGPGSKLAAVIGADLKGKLSIVLYAAAIPLAFLEHWIAWGVYLAVALIWFVPDKRLEAIF